ncbi:hypothetical protein CRUP_013455 [Coryphaenoides rupestris]|nr:hypothetical protein CRUP_013455 [Coryphaenoides rupestris]
MATKVVLDMTFGGGGHTKEILNTCSDVTVLSLDRDPAAFHLAQQLASQYNFKLWKHRLQRGAASSRLIRVSEDVTSERANWAPACVRRYPEMARAADAVNALDQQALASILLAYGEERHARKISSAIVEARAVCPIRRTQQLASVVAGSFPGTALYARRDKLERPSHVATKTFQALRIFVNDELNELHAGLRAAQTLLRPGGRLCVLTFHSLEDRLVKRFLSGGGHGHARPAAPGPGAPEKTGGGGAGVGGGRGHREAGRRGRARRRRR